MKKIVTFLILVTWPLSLLLANTLPNFLNYLIPAVLIFISFILHEKNNKYYFLPLLLIPFVQPKLTVLPLLFLILNFKKNLFAFLFISLLLLILFFKPFFGQTILKFDYEKGQQVIQESQLYPTITLARLFQNKPRIILDKLTNNFFAITDPNNYLFGFAPRQIAVDNQNLKKIPFLSIPFLLIGIYFVFKNKNRKFIFTILLASIINLSVLTSFDRNDFILWIPLFLITLNGINIFDKAFSKKANWYYFIFIIFGVTEMLRIFIMK